jgi:integrating conjugative element protein (TIGR03752 family)
MATSMSSNKLVWVIVGVLCVAVGAAIVNSQNEPPPKKQQAVVAEKPKTVTSADGDTVSETIREVSARYTAQVDENQRLKKNQEELERRLNQLEGKSQSGAAGTSITDDPLFKEMASELGSMQQDFKVLSENMLKEGKEKLAKKNGYEVTEDDLGWGESGGKSSNKKGGQQDGPRALPGYVTIRPMTRSQLIGFDPKLAESMLKDRMSSGAASVSQAGSKSGVTNTLKKSNGKIAPEITPHYTIPARGTIFKAVAMTALIGTVPLGGKVNDPFPAKFIVGEENLATNGLRIPGLKGIVFEGVVRGNWNLSCAAVSLTAATYTFADGRIQHMQYDQQQGGGGSKAGKSTSPFAESEGSVGIGYVTNPQGIPCIPGRRVTDAHKQLFTMGMLGAAKSYFDANAASETTTTDNPLGGGSTSVTGDKAAFINNQTYSDSVETVMDFYSKRMRDTFDVIYVDPAAVVSLNITQDLYIDYHSDARKLAYATGGRDVKSLD